MLEAARREPSSIDKKHLDELEEKLNNIQPESTNP
jgi:hypothetical protein